MVERLFEYLFVLAVFAPPAAVLIGALALIAGPRRRHRVTHATRAVVAQV